MNLGLWKIGELQLKAYGIVADGQDISETILNRAKEFANRDVPPLVKAEGDQSDLGFVIIHCGDLGVSVLVHWWVQGSVLCQHIQRRLHGVEKPMATRPVIACVWELGLINAEQQVWRDTMMTTKPDATAYLNARAPDGEV